MENMQKSSLKDSGWIIGSVIYHIISTSKCNPLAESTYIRLPKKLDHPRKVHQNFYYNECYKWSSVRYLNPEDLHPSRILSVGKYFAKELDFKDVKVPVDTFTKAKKKTLPLVFLVMKIRKNIKFMYQKNVLHKNMLTYD